MGLACSKTLAAKGASRVRILVVPVVLGVLLFVGANIGAVALSVLSSPVVDALLAFGVAALLYLVIEELLVEARKVSPYADSDGHVLYWLHRNLLRGHPSVVKIFDQD